MAHSTTEDHMLLAKDYDAKRNNRAPDIDPGNDKPYMVVLFGMLDYYRLSAWATEEEAQAELAEWKKLAQGLNNRLPVMPVSRECSQHDFDVRTQADLAALTRAIQDGYTYD